MNAPPLLERDARGWKIPRTGTVSRAVYDRLLAGESDYGVMAVALKISRDSAKQLAYRIRNPETHNKSRRVARRNKQNQGST